MESDSPKRGPLLGLDEATIDDKGRILVSKKKRDRLGEPFAISLGAVGCLVAYPQDVWDDVVKTMLQHDAINRGGEIYTRLVLPQSDDELRFDAQGRVVIPQKMRDLGRITDKSQVLLLGCGNRLEIWSKEEYAKYRKDPENYGSDRWAELENAKDIMRKDDL